MPGGGEVIAGTAVAAVASGAFFGPVFLSGYCLHRVKYSTLEGTRRYYYYALSWLISMAPVLLFGWAGLVTGHGEKSVIYAACAYVGSVTAALFGVLRFSPPDKRRRMYLPGIFAIVLFSFLCYAVSKIR